MNTRTTFPADRDRYAELHGSERLWPLLRKKLWSAGQQSLPLGRLRRFCAAQLGVELPSPEDGTKAMWIGKDVYLDDVFPELIRIEPGAVLGLRCMVICHDDAHRHVAPITIGRGAFVGAGAILLPGVNIGSDAKIGAGAVVTKNVPAGEVWAGAPARPLRRTPRVVDDTRSEPQPEERPTELA